MRQLILPAGYRGEPLYRLEGKGCRYLVKVLRLGPGDSFPAADSRGRPYTARILETGGNFCMIECLPAEKKAIIGALENETAPITLLQCLPKGKKLETIVRQAVEAGASRIVIVESEHTVPQVEEGRGEKRAERLRKIAVEAAQQSGNRGVPDILGPVSMQEVPSLLADSEQGQCVNLFFHQEPLEHGSLHMYLNDNPQAVSILIGPEGGISVKETEFLLASGFHPVYLGGNVLRTETAAIYALGAVKTILLEKEEWKAEYQK